MISRLKVGDVLRYFPNKGTARDVRVKGFRLGWVETDGVADGRHRSVSPKQLFEIE